MRISYDFVVMPSCWTQFPFDLFWETHHMRLCLWIYDYAKCNTNQMNLLYFSFRLVRCKTTHKKYIKRRNYSYFQNKISSVTYFDTFTQQTIFQWRHNQIGLLGLSMFRLLWKCKTSERNEKNVQKKVQSSYIYWNYIFWKEKKYNFGCKWFLIFQKRPFLENRSFLFS